MGLASLFGGGSTSVGNATIAAGKKNQLYTTEFRDRGLGAIEANKDNSSQMLGQARDVFTPYVQRGQAAGGMYDNAIGLNGASGNAAVTGAFQAGPGYGFAMDQGLQALDRQASSRGMLASGNSTTDALGFAQGLANQEYGGWLDRLAGVDAQGFPAAGGQANTYGKWSDLYQGVTQDTLGVEHGYTTGMISGENQIADAMEQQALAKEKSKQAGIGGHVGIGKDLLTGGLSDIIGGGGKSGSGLGGMLNLVGRFL